MSVVKSFKRPSSVINKLTSAPSNVVGQVVNVTNEGIAIVDFPQNTTTPIAARSLLSDSDCARLKELPASVLLTFENSDLSKPIIMGIISDILFAPTAPEETVQDQAVQDKAVNNDVVKNDAVKNEQVAEESSVNLGNLNQSTDLKVDGKRMILDAKEEILLRCGKSSILLRKNGKIVIKGANLVSRSSASNKIKGSSVNIN